LAPRVQDEAADVLMYLLKLAYQTGIDLEAAFLKKQERNAIRFASAEKTDAPAK
jgi:NTP pyrophosphatase (non-canonical NTP hydrolase)